MKMIGFEKPFKLEEGNLFKVYEQRKPTPENDDILVKVNSISVNPVDTKQRQMEVTQAPRVLGFDAIGTVEAIGPDVTLFSPGDVVFYAGSPNRQGSNATYQLVSEAIVAKAPHNISANEAVSLPLTGITAYETFFDTFKISHNPAENEGLHFLFNVPSNFTMQVILIVIATILFTWSAWSGIDKGIKTLSNINMLLAFVVLIGLFIVGPTLYILNTFTNGLGNYIANFFSMSLRIPSGGQKFQWLQNWTIFYWAWWISWAPFVGIFIARVSKGRTIKEFILGVLFVPALVCFIFFAVFGASAIYLQDNHIADIAKAATETATFATLQHYPLGFVLSLITLLVIMIFFVTSADSATYVLGMLSSRGDINPKSFVKVSWGIIMALFAIIMIYTGGTQAIQNLLIIAALPFSVVIIAMIWSLLKSLSEEKPRNSNKVLIKHRDPDILEYRSSKHIDEN